MIEPFSWSAIITLAATGERVMDQSKRNATLKAFKILTTKNKKIIVFGISGTGKSQFINNLKNNLRISESTTVTDKVRFNVDDIPVEFIDTPGQEAKNVLRAEEVRGIIKGGVEGIINVVSYGFEENSELDAGNIFTTNSKLKQSFLKINRKSEINRLNEWLPHIKPDDVNWILNLVNKADLWHDKFSEVESYYNSGKFKKAFEHHEKFMNIVTLPYCSIIKPYFNKYSAGTFGELDKSRMHNYLLSQFYKMLS